MPQQTTTVVENNFTKGLITESTGLNFPENASTDCDNTTFSLIGGVTRREGIDFEDNFGLNPLATRALSAVSTYKWNNAGGDGLTQVVVSQVGSTLYFYKASASTGTLPISRQILVSTVNILLYLPTGSTTTTATVVSNECQFTDGNGYLFVFHANLDPFYCTYSGGTVTSAGINIQTRDFNGIPETNTAVNFRPPIDTNEHFYNLQNQGWAISPSWTATSTTGPTLTVDSNGNYQVASSTFQIQSGLTIVNGSYVTLFGGLVFTVDTAPFTVFGQVVSYSGTSLQINVISSYSSPQIKAATNNLVSASWTLSASGVNNKIVTWNGAIGNFPSNADIWWAYKNTSGVFDPAVTINNFPPPSSPAPKGHFLLNEFRQSRATISNISTITDVNTFARPKTGTWYAGRVWYTGVDDAFSPTGDMPYYTWTENIYFSQIVVDNTQFGLCFQENDPTDENFFDLLPTDGGVIKIQGCGSIYKLFPTQNGMLVFAGNGVWFITGSQGIGFAANDYTVTKISNIQSISSTSFVNVMGLPYFWNEEGIYQINMANNGSLSVDAITVGTILTFYNSIPKQSKKFVRGAYHPIDYIVQWIYVKENEVNITDRYAFNGILNYNVYNKAFFPYSIDKTTASVNSIQYVEYPGGTNTPVPGFKYFSSYLVSGNYQYTFAEEHDPTFVDWHDAGAPVNYTSYFVTGYKLRGQAIMKFQPQFVQMYSNCDGEATSYKIQGIWDYANSRSSGRWSSLQLVTNGVTRYGIISRRHRIRGRGLALQFKITSTDGLPFDIQGWAVVDTINTGT